MIDFLLADGFRSVDGMIVWFLFIFVAILMLELDEKILALPPIMNHKKKCLIRIIKNPFNLNNNEWQMKIEIKIRVISFFPQSPKANRTNPLVLLDVPASNHPQ